jgi:hypothetical protein
VPDDNYTKAQKKRDHLPQQDNHLTKGGSNFLSLGTLAHFRSF